MNRETIRGKHNEIRGYLETKNEEVILRNSHNEIAGRYNESQNKTYSRDGKIVSASGNTLLTLLGCE